MPQRPQLPLGQKGSVLVMVMAFSIVLAMAAGSLLLVAGNATNDEDAAFRRLRCANDAESGLMIGVGWLRNSGSALIAADQPLWPLDKLVLNLPNPTFENGAQVTVTIVDNVTNPPTIPAGPPKTVISRAILDDVNVQFSWDVDIDALRPPGPPPPLKLTNFRSL